jgi:fructokinase
MNVAYHLKKLGSSPALISKIAPDEYGKAAIDILAKSGVSTEFFQVDYEHPTGLVYANVSDHEVIYDIVLPSAWDFIAWNDEFNNLLRQADYFVFGSLTSRTRESRETLYQCLEIAKTKVLDINIRPPHFNRSHLEYLLNRADVLKMNEGELELITGWFSPFNNNEDRIRLIQDKFNIETLIVTMGGDGAIVDDKGYFFRHPGFRITVADTIGSGDAFLAGYIYQLLQGSSTEKSLEFASAMGAFIATQSGACPRYNTSQVDELLTSHSLQHQ